MTEDLPEIPDIPTTTTHITAATKQRYHHLWRKVPGMREQRELSIERRRAALIAKRGKSRWPAKAELTKQAWLDEITSYHISIGELEADATPVVAVPEPERTDHEAELTQWEHEIQEKPDVREAIEWVSQTSSNKKVTLEQAPSALAAQMLQMTRDSQKFREQFFATMLPKIMPKDDLEAELKAFQDDGGVLKVLKKVEKAALAASTEARKGRTMKCPECGAKVDWTD